MSAPALLVTYLRDHHAGSVVGAALARRLADENSDNEYADSIRAVAAEIEEDKVTLESLMERLEVKPDSLKDLTAAVGERLGRLKPNGRWLAYSPLSRLLELEGLAMGVTGKLALWRALRRVRGETVEGIDLAALEERAESQRAQIEELRLRAAAEALVSD